MKTCETCRFWEIPNEGAYLGECRRHAPRPAMDGQIAAQKNEADELMVFWPGTRGDDWCGEYQPAEAA